MPDEPSLGEVVRRLDRIERQLQDLSTRVVSAEVYLTEQRAWERRVAEIERDVEDLRRTHADDIKDLRAQLAEQTKTGSSNFRQAIFNGALPSILLLVSMLVTVLLALRGGK